MLFTKLRLSGFKSFVQPCELLIEPGLTGVVGPNGCGKSNLVEALRWAMGESSARGLRGGEMDDVIFAGTAARPAYDLAEVVLHLRGGAPSVPELGEVDELELCRRIGRGIGSSYRINGKEVRARDVQLLFADAASGARSAAIISQGQIGSLVEAKPTERRRILEDAAGIAGLQARRHEAELRLQAAEANLERVQDLLLTLAEQHERLRKQARQAARYRDLSAALRETEAALLAGRWQAARNHLAVAETELEQARGRVATSARSVAQMRQERDAAAAGLQRLRAQEATMGADLARLGERLQAAASDTARFETRRGTLRERDQQLANDLTHADAALEDARTTLARLEDERRALRLQDQDRALELGEAEAALAAARTGAEEADAAFRQALATQADLDARLAQIRDRRDRALGQRHEHEAARTQTQDELERLGEPSQVAADMQTADAEAGLAAALAAADQAEGALRLAEERAEAARHALAEAEQRHGDLARRQQTYEAACGRIEDNRRRLLERSRDLSARRERLAARRAQVTARIEEREARRVGLGLEGLEAAQSNVEAELEQARETLADLGETWERARGAAERARMGADEARAALAEAESEARALAELAGAETDFTGVIDRITVQDGYADAVAAALGDDLLASLDPAAPSFWQSGPGVPDDGSGPAALPEGVAPLADFVTAPPALARRLAQIGIIEGERAEAVQAQLLQGQRLVSREGGLWRWDGLVRRPDGGRTAAARLHQQARRRALERTLAVRRHELDERQSEADAAVAAARGVATELEQADHRCQTCEAARAAAAGRLNEARSADGALLAELAALADEATAGAAEEGELREVHDSLQRELGTLREAAGAAEAAPELGRALAEAEAARARCERADEEAQASHGRARGAALEARRQAAAAQAELERWHAAARAAASAAREQERIRARLEAELARIARDLETLMAMAETARAESTEIEGNAVAARARLAAAEAELGERRRGHADAAAHEARLRDRQAEAEARLTTLAQEAELWRERAEAGASRLQELVERRRVLQAELDGMGEAPAELARREQALRVELGDAEARRLALERERTAAEGALQTIEAALEQAEAEQLQAREAGARLEERLERAVAECEVAEAAWRDRAPSVPVEVPADPPAAETLACLEARLAKLGAARERLGPVNLRAVQEAAELDLRLKTLEGEREELSGAIERLRRAIGSLNREGRERLRAAFAEVERHFEALFTRLFGGGQARLALTDFDDPLAAGLELMASPPGKKLQSLSLLSGGEKALTALALVFAVFLSRPSPLCILDEVDAPLDDANVERLADLLEELAEGTRTRFVVVTHHPLTMARMNRLYGVTMLERGVSQLVSVDLGAAVALRATA